MFNIQKTKQIIEEKGFKIIEMTDSPSPSLIVEYPTLSEKALNIRLTLIPASQLVGIIGEESFAQLVQWEYEYPFRVDPKNQAEVALFIAQFNASIIVPGFCLVEDRMIYRSFQFIPSHVRESKEYILNLLEVIGWVIECAGDPLTDLSSGRITFADMKEEFKQERATEKVEELLVLLDKLKKDF